MKKLLDRDAVEHELAPRYRGGIKTYLPTLDRALQGGLHKEDICTVVSAPKFGTTSLLVNLCAGALYQNLRFLYYSIGGMTELDIRLRLTMRVTGMTLEQLLQGYDPSGLLAGLAEGAPEADFDVVYRNPRVQRIWEFADRVREHRKKAGAVDLLVIDHPSGLLYQDQPMGDIAEVYDMLRVLANEFQCVVCTSAPVRREAWGEDADPRRTSLDSIAESFHHVFGASIVLGFEAEGRHFGNDSRAKVRVLGTRRGQRVDVPVIYKPKICIIKERLTR